MKYGETNDLKLAGAEWRNSAEFINFGHRVECIESGEQLTMTAV